jgi:hypothetical protein
MPSFRVAQIALPCILLLGCSRAPQRFKTPKVDVESAATQAIELYDANHDGALNKDELVGCPGMLGKLAVYDRNSNATIERDEIVAQLNRLLNRTGGTQLTITIKRKGTPLRDAKVVLDPEPYLGNTIQAATGVTNGAGWAEMEIPPEFVPEHLRRIKTVHYGTFKVRVTHPTQKIPAKYNTSTVLGYETEPGIPNVTLNID